MLGAQPALLWVAAPAGGWVPLLVESLRWGIPREPAWVDGAVTDNPNAAATLVTKTVTVGKTGRLFGLSIDADEANTFGVYEDATEKLHFSLGSAGVVLVVTPGPILDSIAASVVVTIKNIGAGGGAGKKYQARLLYDEA